ncbi:hypothetical protein [Micromonospora sp. CPCC 206061]|uniref:hypothetical protein n=1 Tax=Micromonospora sp. CPCC 206061 TaxID=3122410 RepID=UPI002FF0D0A9
MKTESQDDRDERVRAAVRSHIATQPVPPPDLTRIVARAERAFQPRRRSGWVAQVAAAAVAVVVCGTVTAVAVTRPESRNGLAPVVSPDRIPDFARLAGPEVVWPDAVRRLPSELPDGSAYRVADTTDGDDLLVIPDGRAAGPLFLNPDTGAVRAVATASVTDGLNAPRVTTARVTDDRVVWFLQGRREGNTVREAWSVPLAGGEARRLADLPASATAGRVVLAGDAMIWEQYGPGQGQDDVVIRRLPLAGGPITDVPGSRGYWLSTVPGWITSQYPGTPFGEPERTGTLIEVATGQRLKWSANDEMESTVACGPAWCTGWTVGGFAALQDLNGGNYLDLRERGGLNPSLDGRLAIGGIAERWVVWDRGSGRAATIERESPRGGTVGGSFFDRYDSDPRSPVQTWRSPDGAFMMLDLKRLW